MGIENWTHCKFKYNTTKILIKEFAAENVVFKMAAIFSSLNELSNAISFALATVGMTLGNVQSILWFVIYRLIPRDAVVILNTGFWLAINTTIRNK